MKVCVYEFNMGDVEDPEIYAAGPLINWQNSEEGKWVLDNAIDKPVWHINIAHDTYGYKCSVIAELEGVALTFFNLKYNKKL